MRTVLDNEPNFLSLSVKDLLEARDLYHFHLLDKANVVGTAIGLYLIRDREKWPTRPGEGARPLRKVTTPRTLANSQVRDYSWPAVLVFVREWAPESAFAAGGRHQPTDFVPKRLYMPDGRAVPVCVVKVDEVPDDPQEQPLVGRWPMSWLGGGLPIIARVQESERRATAGGLVTDGHLTYVLTARHACGEPGTQIFSRLRGGEVEIGQSSARQLTRLPFSEVYPDFPGRKSYLTLDVGLVRVNDVNDWTSNVYGLPAVGHIADVYEQNLTLKLIDQPVVAFGAASGVLEGSIKALFYRYRSVGGYDYVADFLVAPAPGKPHTRHGDSGAIWHLDVTVDEPPRRKKPLAERDLRPLAVEWGGQSFGDRTRRSNFAVATSLSNVCKILDVELVTDLDRGVQGYWGRVGHYSIASLAIDLVGGNQRLRKLLRANVETLSYDLPTIRDEKLDALIKDATFIPLADVPDEVWKTYKTNPGGRDIAFAGAGRTTGPEHPTHYADIDIPYGDHGRTLRALCLADDSFLTVDAWLEYYARIAEGTGDGEGGAPRGRFNQGLLPFRVWQFFDGMVDFARARNAERFVAAAGIVAHYVGDACQPLHGSMYSNGDPSRKVERHHPQTGKVETVNFADGVHSAYETKMIDRFKSDLLQKIAGHLPASHGLTPVGSGHAAARAIVKLMDQVADIIAPLELCEAYQSLGASPTVPTLTGLWSRFGDRTAQVMALGIRTLAMIWQSAWAVGQGNKIPAGDLVTISDKVLRRHYNDRNFVRSLALDEIGPVLR